MLKRVFRENWLTRDPAHPGLATTVALALLLAAGRLVEFPASGELVFGRGEYWRAWTTLFVHSGPAHLLSNLVLFIPFAFVLTGYYGWFLFPFLGFLVGGLVNLAVLREMPAAISLVGASGVVYWMGAVWITLAILVDRRERLARRVLKGFGVAMLLYLPEGYRPEVSYVTHLYGFLAGIACAVLYYYANRATFRAAERYEYRYDFDAHWDPRLNGYGPELPEEAPLDAESFK
ncbi:MAG: rhomboid family intramembrane serine protease [Bdellovibrionales bacterium]|nr:rhomboid family intramembrane serine protease [Bdellovibrionales bacterium]